MATFEATNLLADTQLTIGIANNTITAYVDGGGSDKATMSFTDDMVNTTTINSDYLSVISTYSETYQGANNNPYLVTQITDENGNQSYCYGQTIRDGGYGSNPPVSEIGIYDYQGGNYNHCDMTANSLSFGRNDGSDKTFVNILPDNAGTTLTLQDGKANQVFLSTTSPCQIVSDFATSGSANQFPALAVKAFSSDGVEGSVTSSVSYTGIGTPSPLVSITAGVSTNKTLCSLSSSSLEFNFNNNADPAFNPITMVADISLPYINLTNTDNTNQRLIHTDYDLMTVTARNAYYETINTVPNGTSVCWMETWNDGDDPKSDMYLEENNSATGISTTVSITPQSITYSDTSSSDGQPLVITSDPVAPNIHFGKATTGSITFDNKATIELTATGELNLACDGGIIFQGVAHLENGDSGTFGATSSGSITFVKPYPIGYSPKVQLTQVINGGDLPVAMAVTGLVVDGGGQTTGFNWVSAGDITQFNYLAL